MTTHAESPTTTNPPIPERSWTRLGGWMGVVFVIVFSAILLSRAEGVYWDASPEEIRDYWTSSGDGYLVGQFVTRLALFVAFPLFLSGLVSVFRRERGLGPLPDLVLLAGGLHMVVLVTADAAWAALAAGADRLGDDSLVALMYLDRGAYQAPGFTLGLFLLATAWAALRGGVTSSWFAVTGLVFGAVALADPLTILADDPESPLTFVTFFAAIGSHLWMLALGATMIRRSR